MDRRDFGEALFRHLLGLPFASFPAYKPTSIPHRNVPGVALYFYTLQSLRQGMTTIPYFAPPTSNTTGSGSVLPKLSTQANLLAGATSRVAVGFLLNPITVIKARYEVRTRVHLRHPGPF